jgi:hypothetical protein
MIWENDGFGNFSEHEVDSGKESHLGARTSDLDGDGDQDLISIAWDDFRFVHLWVNEASLETTPNTYTLEVNTVGSGTVLVVPDKVSYNPGETVQLTALPTQGWAFDSWNTDLTSSTNPATLVMDNNKVVKAAFFETDAETHTLGVDTVGNGTVLVNPNKTSYNPGETLQLTALPAQGWAFDSWSSYPADSANPTSLMEKSDNPLEFTIQEDTTLSATFTQDEYTLTINTVGSGSVKTEPKQTTYFYGDVVTMTAVADTSWSFSGWSGSATGNDNPEIITIQGNAAVTTTFTITFITNTNRLFLPLITKPNN